MRAQFLSPIVLLAAVFANADPVLEFRVPEAPATTPAPEAYLVRHRLLQARAAGPNTCGWVGGIQTNSLTCIGSAQCAHNTKNLVFGCCSDLNNCFIPTVCFDSTLARQLSIGGGPLTQACTGSQSYCQTYVNDGGYYGFGCGTLAGEIFFVRSTYSGGSAVANSVVAVTAGSGSAAAAATAQAFNNVGGGVVTSLSGTNIPSPTASSSGSSSSSSSSVSSSGSPLSTGAIVAIAVCGGLVVIAAIALIAFLVHKKHKKNKPSAVVYEQAPPQGPQSPPGQPGWQPPIGKNVSGQPATHANMEQLHAAQSHQGGEWDFTKQGVAQYHTADNDGIKVTEIRPEEAVDERHQVMSQVGSTVAPTALAPTMVSHHPQGV